MSSPDPDPKVVHAAIEEIRDLSGQNVIAAIGSQIAELRGEVKAENAEIRSEVKAQGARIEALGSRIDAVGSHIDALGGRIDTLQKVIWPLIAILATSVFGLLYKAVTG